MNIRDILKIALAAAVFGLGLADFGHAADAQPVKLQGLRGGTPVNQDNPPTASHQERDTPPKERDFVQQPPLIPHPIEKYAITMKANDCFECHAGTRDGKADAVRPSNEHFKDREGKLQNALSPARYFCDQCHVPQTDAKPLIDNAFRSADAR